MLWQEWVSIALYLVMMLLIGYVAYKRTTDSSDYMLGGRKMGPGVTAMSAGASDMSGWMLMGLPGAMYATGLSAIWLYWLETHDHWRFYRLISLVCSH